MHKNKIELLAPAKDIKTAVAAIQCGADAVYIGAPRFSARQAAGNSIESIQKVVEFAHPYYVKVYAALNTLLFDNELPIAEKMIRQLYKIGIDGLMIQDVGLLELDLPPIPLIASTQMNNDSAEKVKFLEDVGFSRVILARELTLEQIREIRKHTTIELEFFIHGALCVGASGQCYMSYAIGGRSANRGICAQPCRRSYTLKDTKGKIIVKDRYLLSLKDLNLSDYLEELIDSGVNAFKIEGRLKEIPYVANVVGFYRQKLDVILAKKGFEKSSSGKVSLNFKPDLYKTFNRGYTDYGITGKRENMGSINTPKSIGEFVGTVIKVERDSFTLEGKNESPPLKARGSFIRLTPQRETSEKSLRYFSDTLRDNRNTVPIKLNNGDGICFFDKQNNLDGTIINGVKGSRIYPQKLYGIRMGIKIYRNLDHEFIKQLETNPGQRKISISLVLRDAGNSIKLISKDSDNNEATSEIKTEKIPAQKKEKAKETITTQLQKLGNTIFESTGISIETKNIHFFPVSVLNELRRSTVRKLLEIRESNRPINDGKILRNNVPYPEKRLTYLGNVLNKKAQAFYHRHGAEKIGPAAESGIDLTGKALMQTKYCILHELGLCAATQYYNRSSLNFKIALGSEIPHRPAIVSVADWCVGKGMHNAETLILEDENSKQFKVEFECSKCGMKIYWDK
ncbi:MAG: U32 family peptidase [Candidatus Ratteibacteria bacterium]|nr:U32 family peptidase [Candidatus Ratteibacteria bacterium]